MIKHGQLVGLREGTAPQCGAFKSWYSMIRRCRHPNDKGFARYGARGIVVCDRWLDFRNFLADMGDRPPGYSIDRIDNSGSYSPENGRWATKAQQQRNRGSHSKSTSRFKGVRFSKGKWEANITIDRVQKYLGRFESELDAALAYNAAAEKTWGQFAGLNKIEDSIA